jgi:hypothetical protein
VKDCATNKLRFETQTPLALEVAFDGGRLTSDGGLLWLSEVDEELGLCEVMAKHVPEWRKRRGHHSLVALLKQRVLQIACGYEDQNDANTLRADPLLKLVCGSLPETGSDLASQPTISRLENAVSARACYLMAEALFELYLRERANKNGAPKKVLLDLDSTADPPHPRRSGRQLLPRLLRAAHLPSPARFRRRECSAHHGRLTSRQHPRQPLCSGHPETDRHSFKGAMAFG